MNIIRVVDLVKVYRTGSVEVQALRGASLTVKQAEFIAIMGPSGSGKTTFLNILSAVDVPTAGSVEVDGITLSTLSEKEQDRYRLTKIGYVFQDLNLIPTLTAFENVQVPMIAMDVDKKRRHERATELLEMVGILERAEHTPSEMSGGERQRVAIAGALANDPPIILADEPTGILDSTNALEVVGYLRHSVTDLGKTVIMVTHDANMVRDADRVLHIQDGLIRERQKPLQVSESESKSYAANLKNRLSELRSVLTSLDKQLAEGKIGGPLFCAKRSETLSKMKVLRGELEEMGFFVENNQ